MGHLALRIMIMDKISIVNQAIDEIKLKNNLPSTFTKFGNDVRKNWSLYEILLVLEHLVEKQEKK